jgi:hypothetical protein
MSVRKINFYFDALSLTREHRQLFIHMDKLIELQQVFVEIAPLQLARFCTLGAFFEGNLTICASNGAIAAKVRQIVPSLLRKFQARGYEVTAIRIAVQADCNSGTARSKLAAKRGIDPTGMESLAQLAKKLPGSAPEPLAPSSFKSAIIALLETQAQPHKTSE